jgi:hypothetical protein
MHAATMMVAGRRCKITGRVFMIGASFDGALDALSLEVGGDLLMSGVQDKTSFKEVNLSGAKVEGQIYMIGASFDGTLAAGFLRVGGGLDMGSDAQNKASFRDVYLSLAKITGSINMAGASFDGELTAPTLEVGGDLLMNGANFKHVVLPLLAHHAWLLRRRFPAPCKSGNLDRCTNPT